MIERTPLEPHEEPPEGQPFILINEDRPDNLFTVTANLPDPVSGRLVKKSYEPPWQEDADILAVDWAHARAEEHGLKTVYHRKRRKR